MSTSIATDFRALKPRILHTAYFVSDIERSLKFYCDVLGMQEAQRFDLDESVHEVVLTFPDSKGGGVILMWDDKRTVPYEHGDAYSRVVMMVSSLDAAIDHFGIHGVKIVKPATHAGQLRYCMIQDPDGYTIEVMELKRPGQ